MEEVQDRSSTLSEDVMQTLGSASLCWNPKPDGVFDSEEAIKWGERLIAIIEKSDPVAELLAKIETAIKDSVSEVCGVGPWSRAYRAATDDAIAIVRSFRAPQSEGGENG
jgi:hypothetical protein